MTYLDIDNFEENKRWYIYVLFPVLFILFITIMPILTLLVFACSKVVGIFR